MNTSSRSASLSWDPPPLEHQNGLIVDYSVKLYSKGEEVQKKESHGEQSTTFGSLQSNTQYEVMLAAVTSAGVGPYSERVTMKTQINGKKSKFRQH